MLKKILIGIVVVLLVAGCGVYYWMSNNQMFEKVTVSEMNVGPLTFVYTTHKGDYSKISADMMALSQKVQSKYDCTLTKGFAIFYDDPKVVAKSALRSDVGFLLEGKDASKMNEIMKSTKVRWIGPKNYVTATFPIKNNMSYMVGAIKVYPELSKYMAAKGYKMAPSFEMYDMNAKVILYGMEIKK
jgi:DNA gyrase inhibitor GyrI